MKRANTVKLFLTLHTIFFVVLAFLSYMAYDSYNSPLAHTDVPERFAMYSRMLTAATIFSFVILLILSNITFLRSGSGIYFLMTLLLFTVFTLLDYSYITENFSVFKRQNGLWEGGFSVAGIYGVIYCGGALLLTSANYLILKGYAGKHRLT